jgi:hypothetical protein
MNQFPDGSKSNSNLPSDFCRIVLPSILYEVLWAVPVNLSADCSPAIKSTDTTKKATNNDKNDLQFILISATSIYPGNPMWADS